VAIAEQPPVVAVAFGLGDESRAGTHRVEILDKNFGRKAFLLLRMERMIPEFRDNLFRKQFYNNRYLHCRNAGQQRTARRGEQPWTRLHALVCREPSLSLLSDRAGKNIVFYERND